MAEASKTAGRKTDKVHALKLNFALQLSQVLCFFIALCVCCINDAQCVIFLPFQA